MPKSAIQFLARFPIPFSLSLAVFFFIWISGGYDFIVNTWALPAGVRIVVSMVGIIFAYNLAVLINTVWFKLFDHMNWLDKEMISLRDSIKKRSQLEPNTLQPLGDDFSQPRNASPDDTHPKIGMILAGGGAKGVYQAGAMRAIYEYLEKGKLLGQVTMLAGSSIGSWNALFWLADLVRPFGKNGVISNNDDQKSFHQIWWEQVRMNSMFMPRFYFPLITNALVSVEPWKKQFDKIFGAHQAHRDPLLKTLIHFYLTKANIVSGKLDFATNNRGSDQGIRVRQTNSDLRHPERGNESLIAPDRYTVCNSDDAVQYLKNLKDGIFASMTFPPLIPQQARGSALYEDGGVVDNLPIYFGSVIEDCDYLFILPLNLSADVERQQINTRSLISRIVRVMGVREGSQEELSLKKFGLSNELGYARWLASNLEERRGENQDENAEGDSVRSLGAAKNVARVGAFAICPDKIIVDTLEFWKKEEMEAAFRMMYKATAKMLQEKDPLGTLKQDMVHSAPPFRSDYEVQLYKVESTEKITAVDLESTLF